MGGHGTRPFLGIPWGGRGRRIMKKPLAAGSLVIFIGKSLRGGKETPPSGLFILEEPVERRAEIKGRPQPPARPTDQTGRAARWLYNSRLYRFHSRNGPSAGGSSGTLPSKQRFFKREHHCAALARFLIAVLGTWALGSEFGARASRWLQLSTI